MARLSYMQRRRGSGIYEFRKRLPTALAGQPAPEHLRAAFPELVNAATGRFKRELVRSLNTSDPKAAKRLNFRCAHEVQSQLDSAVVALARGPAESVKPAHSLGRAMVLDLDLIERETLAELLAKDAEEREQGDDRRRLFTGEERAQWPDLVAIPEAWARGMAEDHAHVYGLEITEMAGEYRAALARHDPGIVRAETVTALRRHQILVDPTSEVYHRAGIAVLSGHVRAFDAMLQRQRGDVVPTPAPAAAKPQLGPKLSKAFALWQEGTSAAGARKPRPRSVLEARAAVRWFTQLHGDMRLGEITKATAREYQRALSQAPSRVRGVSLAKLAKGKAAEGKARGAATVNKSLTMLAAIVSYAQREGLLDAVPSFVNPFGKDVKVRVDKTADDGREIFQRSDLAAIFGSAIFTQGDRPIAGGGEAAFWFPLIALFSGMRLEEIAGLRLRDLCQDEQTGAWVFDVHERGGREVKTAASIRKVPVHSELERIGLLRYRHSVARAGLDDGSLWPALKPLDNRPLSTQWSKWFGRFLRGKVGITDRRKVFHSFRHTFKRLARDAGIPEEMHDALTGHSGGGGVGKSYGRGVSLKPLIEAMERISPPEAVSGLVWRDWRSTDRTETD
jgi:integrase